MWCWRAQHPTGAAVQAGPSTFSLGRDRATPTTVDVTEFSFRGSKQMWTSSSVVG